jgi:hypothetical protein
MLQTIIVGVIVTVVSGLILGYTPKMKKRIREWWQRRRRKKPPSSPTATTTTRPFVRRVIKNHWIDEWKYR